MAVTFVLVATIAREADDSENNIRAPLVVVGTRVLFLVARAAVGAAWEMWRSDDRGVSWTHHLISDFGGFKHSLGVNQSFWWMYDLNNTEFRRTPEANPGAGGFVSTPMNFTGGHDHWGVAAGTVHIMQPQVSGLRVRGPVALAGEPPATPEVGNTGDNVNSRGVVSIPSVPNNLLVLTADSRIRVLRVSPTFAQLQNVALVGTDDGAILPFPNVAALTASEYWASTDRDIEPSKAWRSTDSGASYTQVNLEANFWSDVPGVTAERRKGHITRFLRVGSDTYAFVRYIDAGGNPAQSGRHMKLAKYDAGANVLRVESNRIGDGFLPIWAGGESALSTDIYIATLDVAGNQVLVYRAGISGTGVSKIPKRLHGAL